MGNYGPGLFKTQTPVLYRNAARYAGVHARCAEWCLHAAVMLASRHHAIRASVDQPMVALHQLVACKQASHTRA